MSVQPVTATTAGEMHTIVDAPPATPRAAWLGLLLFTMFYTLAFLDRQVLSLLVQPITTEFGFTDTQIGLLQGPAFALFFVACSVPLGWIVDRTSRRGVIFAGVVIWSLATACCGLATGFASFFAARLVVGAGEACILPAVISIIADQFPVQRRALATSLFTSGAGIGVGLSLLLGGVLIGALMRMGPVQVPVLGLLHPWRETFLILGLPGLALAFLVFLVREPVRHEGWLAATVGFGRFLRERAGFLSCHFIGFGLVSASGYALISWLPTWLIRVQHWSVAQVGLAIGCVLMVSAPTGSAVTGTIADRLFTRGRDDAHMLVYSIGALAIFVIVVAMFSGLSFWPFLLLLFAVQCIMNFNGVGAAALQLVTPNRLRGRASGLYMLVVNLIGLGVGPSIVGLLTDHVYQDRLLVGSSTVLGTSVLAIAAALVLTIGRRPMRNAVAAARSGNFS